jgi:hypothetical protein
VEIVANFLFIKSSCFQTDIFALCPANPRLSDPKSSLFLPETISRAQPGLQQEGWAVDFSDNPEP